MCAADYRVPPQFRNYGAAGPFTLLPVTCALDRHALFICFKLNFREESDCPHRGININTFTFTDLLQLFSYYSLSVVTKHLLDDHSSKVYLGYSSVGQTGVRSTIIKSAGIELAGLCSPGTFT